MSTTERTRVHEIRRKLCWSILILDQLFGMPTRIPSIRHDIQSPRFLDISGMSQRATIQCQLFPLESYDEMNGRAIGIWSFMIQQISIWSSVRSYVWSCANGHNKSPWSPDSDYTLINSCLLDLECKLPPFVRFGNSRLFERSQAELQSSRHFWMPWLSTQVFYHTTHMVLNHPFLYSQKQSQHQQGPNIFWRTSAELSIVHCRWVTRILGLRTGKNLVFSDPFFAYAASIAATLHFYYSRAGDTETRTTALGELQKCRSFMAEMATHWPVCRSMVCLRLLLVLLSPAFTCEGSTKKSTQCEALDQLVNSATWTTQADQSDRSSSTSVAMNTILMWRILDYAAPRGDSSMGKGIFHPGALDTAQSTRQNDQTIMTEPARHGSFDGLEGSTRAQATSPDWFDPTPSISKVPLEPPWESTERGRMTEESQNHSTLQGSNVNLELPEMANWYWTADPNNETLMDVSNDPMIPFYDRNSGNPAWWDFGDL